MIMKMKKARLDHPEKQVMYSTNASDCIALCQSRYSWCKAVSHEEEDNLCHLLPGGPDDLEFRLAESVITWTSFFVETDGTLLTVVSQPLLCLYFKFRMT